MSVPTTFPTSEQYGERLLAALGSFWYYYFGDRDKLLTHLSGVGHRRDQTYLDYLVAVATISRYDVPVFTTENWYLLVLKQSDRDRVKNIYSQENLTYGGGETYGAPQTDEFLFPLPTDDFFGSLETMPTIYNRVLYPSKSWSFGADFDVDDERRLIRFREDPFLSDYVAKRDVYDESGTLVDQEIGLWVYKGQWDLDLVYKHWAFAIGLQLESSQGYKDLMNAIWDAYAFGSNMRSLQTAVSAMLGVPFVLEPVEKVEDVVDESDRKLVITDKHAYEFSDASNILVSVGDSLVAGQELSDGVTVVDFAGNAPDYTQLSAVTLGSQYLSGGYFAALTFENVNVDLEYGGVDNDGKAVVTFRIQGFPGDVDLFFEKAQEIAKSEGKKTLAELLDLRDGDPQSQPLPVNLPSQINPLQFAINDIMRNHLWLIKIKTSAIDDEAPGLGYLSFFRDIVPPHTSLLIFVEISPDADTMDLAETGDDETPGVSEDVAMFDGVIPDAENLDEYSEAAAGDPSYQDAVVGVFKVKDTCR
jgi:hypothetical protein